ncbi:hypothetical protein WS68_11110 [Burkholderia sp. TSV86]|nr:hypothetical protein WS68_11110 [Burkholderia sp. TSV86]
MESKVFDPGPRTCAPPLHPVPALNRFAAAREHARWMLAELTPDDCNRLVVQRHTDRFSRLCLIGVNPCAAIHQINLRPFQPEHVGLTQASSERKRCDVTQPFRSNCFEQAVGFAARDPTYALRRHCKFRQFRGLIEPPPFVRCGIEQRTHRAEIPILRRGR